MVSNILFTQVNLQHSVAASRIITRTVNVKEIDNELLQEQRYRDYSIRSLIIPGYTLYSGGGTDRPKICILARNMNIWVLTGFSSKEIIAVLLRYIEDGAERLLVVCSAYLPYDFEDPPPSREFEELLRYCEIENLFKCGVRLQCTSYCMG